MAYKIVKSSSGTPESENKCEVLIESSSDLTNLPSDLPIGSEAFLADESKKYRLDADGTWQEIGAAAETPQQQAEEA